ncbi:alpha/beta hydrolase [Kangiella sp. HZ709]|uniref:alpha/beta hydrolase n=1 Tax=Kangiella sp. HZ709 TaxID=2666328 RepID=UPI0012B0167A|nr:alpha/beta fold hydrolase [Kangiella sp. HZ709]MRX27458.1 alpha/beta hydrolase [Kangiella sp. HZ709]
MNKNHILIEGMAGELEAVWDLPEKDSGDYVAVCCHPHPQHGGAMTNKVIYTVSRTLAGLGMPSLRFNFRGVGHSEGAYDQGRGEQQDLIKAIEYAKIQYPNRKLWLAGFSFGSWIAALQAHKQLPTQLISIAPPVNRFSFENFVIPDCDWLVVMGDADEVVEPQAVFDWVDDLEPQPKLIKMEGAGHFFHSRLVDLREELEQSLESNL